MPNNAIDAFISGANLAENRRRNAFEESRITAADQEKQDEKVKKETLNTGYNAFQKARESGDTQGAQSAYDQMAAIDGVFANNVKKAVDEYGVEKVKRNNELAGQIAHGIITAKDPVKAYKDNYDSIPDEAKAANRLVPPEEIDKNPDFVDSSMRIILAKAGLIDKYTDFVMKSGEETRKSKESNALVNERNSSAKLNEQKVKELLDDKSSGGNKWFDYTDNILGVLQQKQEALWTPQEKAFYEEQMKNPVGEYGKQPKQPNPGSPVDFSTTPGGVKFRVIE
jgi:hypothetical protein